MDVDAHHDECAIQGKLQEGVVPVDDCMEDVIHEAAEEDRDIEMGQNDGPCPSVETTDPVTIANTDMFVEVTPQMNHLFHNMLLPADDDMPDPITENSASAIMKDAAAPTEQEYQSETQGLAQEASTTVEWMMTDAPSLADSRPLTLVTKSVGQTHQQPKQHSKPTTGPNQRAIFTLDSHQRYRLIPTCSTAMDNDCLGQGAGTKRKWEGGHEARQTSLCTLKDIHWTFHRLVQEGYASLNGIRWLVTALEAPLYKPAFEFERPTNDVIRTFTGRAWKATRVTTFSDFLVARALRPSGRGPLSLADGAQIIREYLIYRLPTVASTHAVLSHLERCSSTMLEQIVGRSSPPASTQERKLAVLMKQQDLQEFNRAFATPLYRQIQERLFAWMTSFSPARMGKVHVGALQWWANGIRERCRRTKLGQVQDVWRFSDASGEVVLNWVPKDPPKSTEELRMWFLAWLDHIVAPTLKTIAAQEGLQAQYLVGLRQQVDDEIDKWTQDFAQDARAGPQAAGVAPDAVQSIIAECSKK